MKITTNTPVGVASLLPKPIVEMTRDEIAEFAEKLRGARSVSDGGANTTGGPRTPRATPAKKPTRSLADLKNLTNIG